MRASSLLYDLIHGGEAPQLRPSRVPIDGAWFRKTLPDCYTREIEMLTTRVSMSKDT